MHLFEHLPCVVSVDEGTDNYGEEWVNIHLHTGDVVFLTWHQCKAAKCFCGQGRDEEDERAEQAEDDSGWHDEDWHNVGDDSEACAYLNSLAEEDEPDDEANEPEEVLEA
jgi:hypothetical protein